MGTRRVRRMGCAAASKTEEAAPATSKPAPAANKPAPASAKPEPARTTRRPSVSGSLPSAGALSPQGGAKQAGKPAERVATRQPRAERKVDLPAIVERTLAVKPFDEFDRLTRELSLDDATNQHEIINALNRAERNALTAHQIYVAARVAYERADIEDEAELSALRQAALEKLQRQKAEGSRTKQITDGDVRSQMAADDPQKFQGVELRRLEGRKTLEHLERLAELWKQRSRTLASMRA